MQRTRDYVSNSPNQSISNITAAPKAQETPGKREQKDCKSLRDRKSAVLLYPLVMSRKLLPLGTNNMTA